MFSFFFFFNDTATTEIYTLSLHDALPIWKDRKEVQSRANKRVARVHCAQSASKRCCRPARRWAASGRRRSEEHTSELQSRLHLVCRLLLEKKKKKTKDTYQTQQYEIVMSN